MNCIAKSQFVQIQFIYKSIYEPQSIICAYLLFECSKVGLMSVATLYKLHTLAVQELYCFEHINTVCIFICKRRFFHKLTLGDILCEYLL